MSRRMKRGGRAEQGVVSAADGEREEEAIPIARPRVSPTPVGADRGHRRGGCPRLSQAATAQLCHYASWTSLSDKEPA